MLEYVAFRILVGLARILPFPVLRPLLMKGFTIAYDVGLLRRRVVETNLSVALGRAATPARVREVARKCASEHGRIVAELLWPDRLIGDPGKSFRILGVENLRGAASAGRGVIILTGHLGNFILGAYQVERMGYPLTIVARTVRNPAVWGEIEKIYKRYGSALIPIRSSRNDLVGGGKILKSLRRGKTLVLVNDQDAGPEGYRSVFFGVPSYIPAGPAHFAFRTGAVVLTSFATRRGGKVEIDFQPPIDFSGARTKGEAESLILDEYTRRLEAKVSESPEDYFWFHKKWKSSPEFRERYKGKPV
jgi:Kdo2-lipid IVA lauroyltransferase/acyltransferase